MPTERAFDGDLANKTKWEALRFIARMIHPKRATVYSIQPENEQLCSLIYHMNDIMHAHTHTAHLKP